jgi:allantoin racemase
MRIAYIGPEGRNEIIQSWASPGVTVETRSAGFSGAIESMYDEYLYIPSMLEAVRAAEAEGFDAAIGGCFGDPALDGARELVKMPVIGIAESSFHLVSTLADKFGVVTATADLTRMMRRLAEKYGVDRQLAGVGEIGCPIMEIRRDPGAQYPTLLAAGRRLVDGGADALVLGCGSMSFYAERLSQDLGVPCLNPLRVGLRMAELLVGCGLSHSKRSHPTPSSLRGKAHADR